MTQLNLTNILHPLRFAKRLLALFAAFVFLAVSHAQAGTRVWTGAGTSNVWSDAANWTGGAGGADLLTFAGTTRLTSTNNFTDANATNVSINFATNAGAFVLNGNTEFLTVGITNSSTNSIQTLNLGLTFRVATASIATASKSMIMNGVVAGTNITKSGAATLFLNGANTFSGVLSNSAGAIRVGNNNGLGTTAGGTVIADGAALELTTNSAGGNLSISNEVLTVISGTGIGNNGALRNITGSNTFGGAITFAAASEIQSDDGTLVLTNTIDGDFLKTFDGAGNITASGVISGTTGVTKTGAGTFTLSAANTYAGDTIIGVGVARLSGSGSIAAASGVVVSNGATFDFNSISDTVDGVSGAGAVTLGSATLTVSNSATNNLSGTLSGSGGLIKVGAGTQILSGTTNSYGGTTTIGAGVLNVGTLANAGANSSIGTNGTIIITNGGVLQYGGSTVSIDRNINLASGSGVIGVTNSATSLTIAGVISNTGSLVKTNAGELILSGANNYSGTTLITNGVLNIQNNTGLGATNSGTTVGSGAALELEGGITIGAEALALSGTGISAGGALRNISGNNTYGGTITNVAASRINSDAGTLTLSGAINANALALTFGGAGNIAANGAITNSTSTLTKDGAGTVILSGSNNYTGATTISVGALRAASSNALGTVAAGTTVASGAALELSGGITIGAETLSLSGTGTNAGGALRNISGDNTYGGTITNVAASRINSDAGTLTLSGAINATNQLLTFGGAGNITANGAITNSTAGVTKTGAGTLTLGSGANTYGGVTTIGGGVLNAGTLANAGTNSSLGTNATIAISNAGKLHYTGGTVSINRGVNLSGGNGEISVSNSAAALTISGAISNTGTLVKSGAGTLILTASNNYQGGTLLNAGTLAAGNAFAFGSGSVTIGSGTTLNLSNLSVANVLINNGGTLTNLGTVSGAELNGGTTTIASSNSTVAEVSGTAQVTVSGVNTTITNVTGGTVSIAGTNTTLQTVDAGTLNIAGTNTTVQTLNGGTVNVTNGRTLVVQSGSSAGAIAGGGGLVKNGVNTLTLSGSNTFTGGAFLNEGTLRLASTTAAGGSSITQSNGSSRLVVDTTGTVTNQMSVFYLQSLQTVTLSGAKTLNNATYDITNNTTTTESGALSGSGGITKLGTGTLAITASNTFTGAVDVQAGVLNLNSLTGSAAGGTTNVAVASGATLLISQNNQVNNAATVSLTGGTIQRASGVSEVFGSLNLTTSSFLDFSGGAAGTITFSGISYTPSALLVLDIANFNQGSSLVFQTTSNLSLSGFTFSGTGGFGSSSFNGTTFTITAIPEPSTYLAAAGLLGLMLWPSRKRILRYAKRTLGLRAPMRDRLAARQA